MILLFFLASLALVYYIVPRPETTPEAGSHPAEPESNGHGPLTAEASLATPGLLALGRALDSYGRGAEPRRPPMSHAEEQPKLQRDRL